MASNLPPSYNSSQALHCLKEEDVRNKGSQEGRVRQIGQSWFIKFKEWREQRDGTWDWSDTTRKIEDGGKKLNQKTAQRLGYDQWVSKANQMNKAPRGMMTLEFFVEHRFTPDVVKDFGPVWAKSVKSLLKKHIVPRFGKLQINEIRRDMVQQWVNEKATAGVAPGTVKHLVKVLRQILDHAANMNIETMNAAAKIRLPRQTYMERTAYTMDQVRQLGDKLRGANKPHYARFLLFLSLTGMRRGEVLALRWCDVDLENFSVKVRGTWTLQELTPGKSKMARREVPLVDEAIELLREQLSSTKWKGVEHPVFAAERGSKPRPFNAANALRRTVKPLAVELGMPEFDWHSERHTMATKLDGHATAAQKQAILGHSSTAMSNRYTHPERGALLEVMKTALVN